MQDFITLNQIITKKITSIRRININETTSIRLIRL